MKDWNFITTKIITLEEYTQALTVAKSFPYEEFKPVFDSYPGKDKDYDGQVFIQLYTWENATTVAVFNKDCSWEYYHLLFDKSLDEVLAFLVTRLRPFKDQITVYVGKY